MRSGILAGSVLLGAMLWGAGAAWGGPPLFLPKGEAAPPLMSPGEAEAFKKEAEAFKRKAALLKAAADKKYAAARELRQKAGGVRSESAKKGEALRSKAEQSAAVSSMLGDMFSIMSSMGGVGGFGGGMNSNAMVASALTSKMIQGQQAGDAKAVMEAQAKSGHLSMEAEKAAGPLEMRAEELENEGNRLLEAHNRLLGIANAKLLLVASDELLRKLDADGRRIASLRESTREFLASVPGR
ncbi:MAG: hypothetical protein Kow00128_18600 [Deltaproteobacteria bacterium]